MTVYSITYDLVKTKDYTRIIEGIKHLSGENWAKPTRSQWIITSTKTSAQIRDHLLGLIDNDDVLFVTEIKGDDWATWNVHKDVVKWLSS